MVTVPAAAANADIFHTYQALHDAGLRVTLTKQVDLNSLDGLGVTLSPGVGARVPAGSTIRISPGLGAIGSPGVLKSDPHFVVPDFSGQSPGNAVRWANQHDMYWAVDLPPITASAAPQLLDAYRLLGQQPPPGATITEGVTHGTSFRPTFLTLTVTAK
jgi:hypothetical protein